jgi:capsular exopolysaccharide synthesis family protein
MEQNNFQSNESNQDEISLVDIFFHYLSYWKIFTLSVILCVGFAYIYLRYTMPEYNVTSFVVVNDEKKGQSGVDMTAFSDLGILTQKNNVDNEIEVLRSKTLMKGVVDTLHLEVSYFKKNTIKKPEIYKKSPVFISVANIEKPGYFIVDSVSSNTVSIYSVEDDYKETVQFGSTLISPWGLLTFQSNPFGEIYYPIEVQIDFPVLPEVRISLTNKTSSVLELSMVTSCPEKGTDIINTLIEHYNRNAINEKNYVANNTIDFINERLEDISKELQVAEKGVESFKKERGITDLQAQGQLLLTSSSEYDKKIKDAEIQRSNLLQIKSFLMSPSNIGNIIPSNLGLTDPTILSLIKTYNEELLKRDSEISGFSVNHPLRKQYENRIVLIKNDLLNGINLSESGLDLTIKELKTQENMYIGKTMGLSSQERESRELMRQQSIIETQLIYLLQKKEETGLSLVTATPNAKIIDEVSYDKTLPVKPKRNIIFLAAFILGIVIPVGGIYIKDLFDNKIHSKDDVIKVVKAPFLGDVPIVKSDDLLPALKIRSSVAEKFRVIVSNLGFVLGAEKTKIIAVTSTTSGDGKSFISRNLALSLATNGKKTLLIDLDLRKSIMDKTFHLKTFQGSAIYLSDKNILIENVIDHGFLHKNLDIIPVKVYPPNPSELLASDRLDQLFGDVKDKYEYIIVDTAPVGLVADAFHINRFVHATIYVTKSDYTFKQSLSEIQDLYQGNKLQHLCCVLNGTSMSKHYGHYGHYGYNYNYYTEENVKSDKKFGIEWVKRIFSK